MWRARPRGVSRGVNRSLRLSGAAERRQVRRSPGLAPRSPQGESARAKEVGGGKESRRVEQRMEAAVGLVVCKPGGRAAGETVVSSARAYAPQAAAGGGRRRQAAISVQRRRYADGVPASARVSASLIASITCAAMLWSCAAMVQAPLPGLQRAGARVDRGWRPQHGRPTSASVQWPPPLAALQARRCRRPPSSLSGSVVLAGWQCRSFINFYFTAVPLFF